MGGTPEMSDPVYVTVYTTETCPWCKAAKAYLSDSGIDFRDVDIIHDLDGRREMLTMTGQYGVPVVRVGEKAMVGWDPREFERLLAIWEGREPDGRD